MASSISDIAQALLQGQTAQVAPTTGITPQLPADQAVLAQALEQQQAPAAPTEQFATPQGSTLASELLRTSQDRLGNPIIRGIAGFLGTKELLKEREAAGQEKRRAEARAVSTAEAKAEQQQFERGIAEREIALKEAPPSDLDIRKAEAEIAKFEAATSKLEREAAGGGDPKDIRDAETKARKEFTNLSKDFFKQRDAFGRIKASAKDPSAAGDLALIFNYMKLLDPGSTVREGEFATAESSGSVPDRVTANYNKLLTGKRLAPDQRNDFVNRSDRLFASADAQHNVRIEAFSGLSERTGLDPKNVTLDLSLAQQEAAKETTKETPKAAFSQDDVAAEIKRRGL